MYWDQCFKGGVGMNGSIGFEEEINSEKTEDMEEDRGANDRGDFHSGGVK